jgi:hypothetical protein
VRSLTGWAGNVGWGMSVRDLSPIQVILEPMPADKHGDQREPGCRPHPTLALRRGRPRQARLRGDKPVARGRDLASLATSLAASLAWERRADAA